MSPLSAIHGRRLALVIPFAAATTITGSTFGDPATACAAPREWDIGAFDACTARVDDAVAGGLIREDDWLDAYRECCQKTGGIVTPGNVGECAAPPVEQAQEAEKQPAPLPAPPGLLDSVATLWMPPPPVGPAAPPAGEATPAP
jgi:hypothetical protein